MCCLDVTSVHVAAVAVHAVKPPTPIMANISAICGIWSLEMPQSTAETANVLGFSVVKGSEAKRMRMSESHMQTPFTG